MNRIDKKFKVLKKKREKAFIAFVTAGDPTLAITKKIIFELEKNGADIIELGIPFSDPLADGPTIQRSSERALKNKVNIDSVCRLVKDVRRSIDTPIAFLTYYNLLHHYNLRNFVKKATSSGVDGVIVPDLPIEESLSLRKIAKTHNFSIIHLLAPTSSSKRIKKIAKASSGFIYYVSITGTTGARKELPKEITKTIKKIKRMAKKPVCVGFGISKSEQVRSISKLADGVIVGSAIVKIVESNLSNKNKIAEKVGNFVKRLRQ